MLRAATCAALREGYIDCHAAPIRAESFAFVASRGRPSCALA
jgi:hypothetical protein